MSSSHYDVRRKCHIRLYSRWLFFSYPTLNNKLITGFTFLRKNCEKKEREKCVSHQNWNMVHSSRTGNRRWQKGKKKTAKKSMGSLFHKNMFFFMLPLVLTCKARSTFLLQLFQMVLLTFVWANDTSRWSTISIVLQFYWDKFLQCLLLSLARIFTAMPNKEL